MPADVIAPDKIAPRGAGFPLIAEALADNGFAAENEGLAGSGGAMIGTALGSIGVGAVVATGAG